MSQNPIRSSSQQPLAIHPDALHLNGTETIRCLACGHGIDPHGIDPGGPCGVGDVIGTPCPCLMSPNAIACALLAHDPLRRTLRMVWESRRHWQDLAEVDLFRASEYRDMARSRRARIDELEAQQRATNQTLTAIDELAAHLGQVARETKQILGIDVTAVDDEIPATVRALLADRDQWKTLAGDRKDDLAIPQARIETLQADLEQARNENALLAREYDAATTETEQLRAAIYEVQRVLAHTLLRTIRNREGLLVNLEGIDR